MRPRFDRRRIPPSRSLAANRSSYYSDFEWTTPCPQCGDLPKKRPATYRLSGDTGQETLTLCGKCSDAITKGR